MNFFELDNSFNVNQISRAIFHRNIIIRQIKNENLMTANMRQKTNITTCQLNVRYWNYEQFTKMGKHYSSSDNHKLQQ